MRNQFTTQISFLFPRYSAPMSHRSQKPSAIPTSKGGLTVESERGKDASNQVPCRVRLTGSRLGR